MLANVYCCSYFLYLAIVKGGRSLLPQCLEERLDTRSGFFKLAFSTRLREELYSLGNSRVALEQSHAVELVNEHFFV